MNSFLRSIPRFPAWIACVVFGAASCSRPGHLSDWLDHADHLPAGEADALLEWTAANGFDAVNFQVSEGLDSLRGPRSVQIRDGRVHHLRADAVKSLQGLAKLSGLHTLELDDYLCENLVDCPPGLSFLSIRNSEMDSLQGIEACTKLTSLTLFQTAIRDFAPLQARSNLTELHASDHDWQQISIPPLPAVTRLDLVRNNLGAITGLERLPKLRNLILRDNRLTALTGIENLDSLEKVDLSGNRIVDTRLIVANAFAQKLNVKNNPITNFSALQAWTGLQKLETDREMNSALPASLEEIAGSGVKPSGREGQEKVARELMEKYLQNVAFVEQGPSGSGRGEGVSSRISSTFSLNGPTDISGTVAIKRLKGPFRLPLASTDNTLYYGRDVSVSGTVVVAEGRLEIYSPVDIDFWEQATLFVDNPARRTPAPGGLRLKGFVVTEVMAGEAKSFEANLLALAGDFKLLLHTPEGTASGIQFTLE